MIKGLSQEGIKIHLHLYHDSNSLNQEIESLLAEVHFYKRNYGHKGFSFSTPYSIGSRADEKLLKILKKDQYPIMFEGIESTYFLYRGFLKNRTTLVRLQNLQSQKPRMPLKLQIKGVNNIYSFYENKLRRSYEKEILKKHRCILTSSNLNEEINFSGIESKTSVIPQFIGMASAMGLEGNGNYCLFHGNLSEKATEDAAIWLLNNIFNVIEVPLVIVGDNPSSALEDAAHRKMHTCIVANPGEKEMMELIKKAQLHILPSFIPNGSKNAILQTIVMGRHILINDDNKNGMEFSMVCHQASAPHDFIQKVNELFEAPFTQDEIEKRHCFLHREFNDKKYVGQLIKQLHLNCL